MVYEDYKIYGPYKRKDNRQHVCLVKNENGVRVKKTVSYPKFLLEKFLGRYLNQDETVDHIDGDFTNNSYDNLKVITRKENSSKGAIRVEIKNCRCVWCGIEFKPSRQQRDTRASKQAGPFCGKSCTGQYGASVQNGGNLLDRDKIGFQYFTLNNNYNKQYIN